MTTKHHIEIGTESLKKVTVFNDRAELKREFTVELAAGQNEVFIQPISPNACDDTVRVTGRGAAVIDEVQVADRRIVLGGADSARAAEVRKEKEDLEMARKRVEFSTGSAQRRLNALNEMIGKIDLSAQPKGEKFTANEATFSSITTFFGFYDEQAGKLREELRTHEKEVTRLSELIATKEHELSSIDHGIWAKHIIVVLEAAEATSVVLEVSYQITSAGWAPFYDMRVQTDEGKTDMQISYYANVYQSSGEDWEGAQLTLSTARPCVGGNIPELGTLDVSFYNPNVFGSMMVADKSNAQFSTLKKSRVMRRGGPAAGGGGLFGAEPEMELRHARVAEHTLATEFVIARPCSIKANGTQHKVSIGVISLEPQLVHESIPSKSTSAFLTASALNSSSLPILAGQTSVYLDGAFVAKSMIKAVSPGERFSASLGVDPSVKIEYKPAHKYHEQTGLINKWSSTVTEQKVVVRNTRADTVLLSIKEQIPRSTDEKIKVKLISPETVEKVSEEVHLNGNHSPKAGVRLLPSNNLEWTVKLEKGASQTLLVKYAVDHPAAERLEFVEKMN